MTIAPELDDAHRDVIVEALRADSARRQRAATKAAAEVAAEQAAGRDVRPSAVRITRTLADAAVLDAAADAIAKAGPPKADPALAVELDLVRGQLVQAREVLAAVAEVAASDGIAVANLAVIRILVDRWAGVAKPAAVEPELPLDDMPPVRNVVQPGDAVQTGHLGANGRLSIAEAALLANDVIRREGLAFSDADRAAGSDLDAIADVELDLDDLDPPGTVLDPLDGAAVDAMAIADQLATASAQE